MKSLARCEPLHALKVIDACGAQLPPAQPNLREIPIAGNTYDLILRLGSSGHSLLRYTTEPRGIAVTRESRSDTDRGFASGRVPLCDRLAKKQRPSE